MSPKDLQVNSKDTADAFVKHVPNTSIEGILASMIKGKENMVDSESNGITKALLRALKFAKVKYVRFGFVDIGNNIRCKAVPIHRLSQDNLSSVVSIAKVVTAGLPSYGDAMVEGSGLDASGNLSLHPDLSSLTILPYATRSAMVMCNLYEHGEVSPFCTRSLLQRLVKASGEAYNLDFCIGAEIEFCLFDENEVKQVDDSCFAFTKTLNEQETFICELEEMINEQGIEVELIHAESAGGQIEVVLKYQSNVLLLADNIIFTKETISSCAKNHKMKAVFLPKISPMQAGNGLHLHMSFSDKASGLNEFANFSEKASVSEKGKSFMEGILKHLPALLSITLPTQNSFRRVGPGCWTGSSATWAVEDKEKPLRVCLDDKGIATNVELKVHDATANIYLSIAAVLLCGLDGMSNSLSLRSSSIKEEEPEEGEEEELDVKKGNSTRKFPSALNESLCLLEENTLLVNGLGEDLIKAFLAIKRAELDFGAKMSMEEELAVAHKRA